MNDSVYALDIGVYRTTKTGGISPGSTTGWCRLTDGVRTPEGQYEAHRYSETVRRVSRSESSLSPIECGRSIADLATAIADDMRDGRRVALGFEAPMWFPVELNHCSDLDLFSPRFDAERSHEWYLQSGAAATVKATCLGVLLVHELRSKLDQDVRMTTNIDAWLPGTMMVYEAFVAGLYKVCGIKVSEVSSDERDAVIAALAWKAVHAGFALPAGFRARTLHTSGKHGKEAVSVWKHIASDGSIEGPDDCEVVAIEDTRRQEQQINDDS